MGIVCFFIYICHKWHCMCVVYVLYTCCISLYGTYCRWQRTVKLGKCLFHNKGMRQSGNLTLLKSITSYKGVEPTAPLVRWFWQVMEEFSAVERSLFLRFVWGRTRLPLSIADFRGRYFVLQVSVLAVAGRPAVYRVTTAPSFKVPCTANMQLNLVFT